MAVEVKVPTIGESVTEVVVGGWRKKVGEAFKVDETVVELESDKATVEVPAPSAGVLKEIRKQEGETAQIGEVLAVIDETASASASAAAVSAAAPSGAAAAASDQAAAPTTVAPSGNGSAIAESGSRKGAGTALPAAERLAAQHGVNASQVPGTGLGGRVLKEDVQRFVEQGAATPAPAAKGAAARPQAEGYVDEEVVAMTPIRKKIAERLVYSKQTMALLTTFNEIDMSNVMALRKQYQESFTAKHGVKLGFMSFFIKAAIEALKQFPQVNAEIRGTNIVYKNYYDIGIAVGGGKGLLVPVIRAADRMSFAELELTIGDFGARAQANKIDLAELEGGTFTVSNGGVYGSLMSTPIVNPPQSGVLGLHAIQDRPVARDGQVVIRPMMYVALTYDHRIIDGRESVSFLKRIKECMEDPARMLLEI
ncbi:2-oxoglutarate dehydrogenase complex dihydrolipoyllysine-residue succinyltransferase [bacterium]|nr:2-oxoglutarate dehydrogenase complex dihydrolipoyllysine-residue succinyltransferase [bacterium]